MMSGQNPLKTMMNNIPVPQQKLKEVLRVEGLSKVFDKSSHSIQALREVDFTLYEGEIVAIMGTSGSGKSTLLNMLSAIDAPTSGKMFVSGEHANIYQEPQATIYRRDHIGFVFQSFELLEDLNVTDNITMPLILKGLTHKEIVELVAGALDQVDMTKWRTHLPTELSGGQQQRVAIARALIAKPPILLADEPTGSLDFNTTNEILNLLVQLNEDLQQTMVIVTHDAYVATFADRVLFFHDGQIVDVYTNEKDEYDLGKILEKFKYVARGGNNV